MTPVRITNDYHHTSTTVRVRVLPDGTILMSPRQERRAWRKLCGITGCTCSGYAGARPALPIDPRRRSQAEDKP